MRNLPETAPYAPGNEASREAASGIHHQLDGIRADVFNLIISRAGHGATGTEISNSTGISLLTVRPRCSELKEAGYIVDSGAVRKDYSEGNNETVWLVAAGYPRGPWKAPAVAPAKKDEPSALDVFDNVFRRNPHLRNTFTMTEIDVIREDLKKAVELP